MFFRNSKRLFPGFGISLGVSMLFICLVIILPLSVLLIQLSKITFKEYIQIITSSQVISSYKITLFTAFLSSIFNLIFGTLIAWIITKYKFPGRNIIDGLIDLPFVLPTAIAGLVLSKLFSVNGIYGFLFAKLNIDMSYTYIGITIAMVFTSIPFVIRSVQAVLENLKRDNQEAAQILGANKWQVFRFTILPEITPALLTGTVLSFTRSLGEFGAIIFLTSNISWKNEVLSLVIFMKIQEFNYTAASAISSVILLFSLLLLFFINYLQNKYIFRLGKK